MNVLALDLATVTGWAYGPAGSVPASGAVRLRLPKTKHRDADPHGVGAFNLLAFLSDRFAFWQPDLVVVEDFLHPTAQRSGDAAITALMLHGVAHAFIRINGIRLVTVNSATWKKHFTGQARVSSGEDAKEPTIRRAHLLGWLPRDCFENNRADAIGIWDWACATHARQQHQPKTLIMHGERP